MIRASSARSQIGGDELTASTDVRFGGKQSDADVAEIVSRVGSLIPGDGDLGGDGGDGDEGGVTRQS